MQFAALHGAQGFGAAVQHRHQGNRVHLAAVPIRTGQFQTGGSQVHQFSQGITVPPLGHTRQVDQQGDAQAAFVHAALFQQAVVAQQLAVVGAEDDDRIILVAGGFQPVQQFADPPVDDPHAAGVATFDLLQISLGHAAGLLGRAPADPGGLAFHIIGDGIRPQGIAHSVIILLRGIPGVVRPGKADGQVPRSTCVIVFVQPFQGFFTNEGIQEHLIWQHAGLGVIAGLLAHIAAVIFFQGAHQFRVFIHQVFLIGTHGIDAAVRVGTVPGAVHFALGFHRVGKAVMVHAGQIALYAAICIALMQVSLAHNANAVAAVPQGLIESRLLRRQHRIMDGHAAAAWVPPRCQGCPAWGAERAGAGCTGKQHAFVHQAAQVRGLDAIPHPLQRCCADLVGHQK